MILHKSHKLTADQGIPTQTHTQTQKIPTYIPHEDSRSGHVHTKFLLMSHKRTTGQGSTHTISTYVPQEDSRSGHIHTQSPPTSHKRTTGQGTYTHNPHLRPTRGQPVRARTHTIPAYVPHVDSQSGHVHTQSPPTSHKRTAGQGTHKLHKLHIRPTRAHTHIDNTHTHTHTQTHTHTHSPPMSHKRIDGHSTHKTRQGLIYYSQWIEQLQMSMEMFPKSFL